MILLIIKQLIQNETNDQDQTVFCTIESVNIDGSLNIYIVPDFVNIIKNIKNASFLILNKANTILYIKNKFNSL